MTTTPINPRPFLAGLVGKDIVVKLKWGMEYIGCLDRADAYMNLQMSNVQEFVDGMKRTEINELLIRCNNVLFVRLLKEGEQLESAAPEESAEAEEEQQPMAAE